jgi:hypothetical protein
MLLRSVLVIVGFGLIAMANFTTGILPMKDIACMEDQVLIASESINEYLGENPNTKHAIQIICSLLMDVMIVSLAAIFAINGRTWRIIIATGIFFSCRMII